MKKTALLSLAIISYSMLPAQKYAANWESLNTRKIPAWFQQEKFGIFIHWGVYAVPAFAPVIPNDANSYSEWYWHRIYENQKDFRAFHDKNFGTNFPYQDFESQFKAELFDPNQWADIFKRSGARYVVLTSKHHEGYCLWNSAESDRDWGRAWNAVTGSPKRDLLGDLTQAVRDSGLRMGYYYSLYEWFNPLWKTNKKRYVEEHMIPQFKDLVTRYKPSIIFGDGEWELPDSAWHSPQLLAWLFNESPVAKEVVINDRWGSNTRGKNSGATYATSEYGSGMDASVIWEESRGIGHSYGYNRVEAIDDYKTSAELVLILVDIVAKGGNLLLDIGPTADGRIPVIMQQRLLDIGKWLQINGEAIYSSKAYKQPYQWSDGPLPTTSEKSFMSGYSIAEMTVPKKDQAHVEAFFTTKGQDLYCFLPVYSPQFLLKDIDLKTNTVASILGTNKKVAIKQKGKDVLLDLSALQPGDIANGLFTIKLANAL